MSEVRKVRVAIDCIISDPNQGTGIAVLALAAALSRTRVQDQEYTFIIPEFLFEWLAPHIGSHCKIITTRASLSGKLKARLRNLPVLRNYWGRLRRTMLPIPTSSGLLEAEQFDVVHFPTTEAYLTQIPSIYQPWDLQHVHYPEYFKKDDWIIRDRLYRTFCDQASAVCVQTEWTKRDLVESYGIASDKVSVIRWGIADSFDADTSIPQGEAASDEILPERFFVYPAVTWPHKNHEAVICALHILKQEHHVEVPVVFTGASTDFQSDLEALAKELNVSQQIHYLGFVSKERLHTIFMNAVAMIYPSKFEGFGLPLLEAFQARLPVIASNATVLPEVGRDGALYFDPNVPSELADLMLKVLADASLRKQMIERGANVLESFTIGDTARLFRELYAKIANEKSARIPSN